MHLHQLHLHTNLYQKWIKTYSSTDFIRVTQHLSNTINTLGNKSTPVIQVKMRQIFTSAVQHKLDFFDEVYSLDNKQQLIA